MNSAGDTLIYRIALSTLPGVTATVADTLVKAFGSAQGVMTATEAELKALPGVPRGIVSAQARYQAVEQARHEADFVTDKGITALWHTDQTYPQRLLGAERPPAMVYTMGTTDLNHSVTVGIVGTRHATAYGTSFTEQFVADLARKIDGIVTVSGLAYGIDVAAHRASLSAGIPTVGIVAHGLNRMYPAAHRDTAARMVRGDGLLLTDYTCSSPISSHNFLARNRLVAALSQALVVVESGERGGALATARIAVKSSTAAFAVPGRVTDTYSAGCNMLIQQGTARCITSADDLIDAMGWQTRATDTPAPADTASADIASALSADERLLLRHIITTQGCDTDMLVAVTGLPAAKVMTILIGLEMRAIVAVEPGNRYIVTQTINPDSLL